MWTYNQTNDLFHHGIKGMRWGIRRFQKKDGSLTSLGKKRYGDSDNSNQRTPSEDHITAKALKRKKVYEMSNKELKTLTERMQLEIQYKNLTRQKMTKGQQMISSVLSEVGKETFKNVVKGFVSGKVEEALKKTAK